jgi:hypothetical protein
MMRKNLLVLLISATFTFNSCVNTSDRHGEVKSDEKYIESSGLELLGK